MQPTTTFTLRPLPGRIIVESIQEDTIQGGIHIPDLATGKSHRARVIAVGIPLGSQESIPIKSQDQVLLSQWSGSEVKLDGKEYRIVKVEDVLAVIES